MGLGELRGLTSVMQAGWIKEGILQTDARFGCTGNCGDKTEHCLELGMGCCTHSEVS